MGPGWGGDSVKCLPCWHKNLSLIPGTQAKEHGVCRHGMVAHSCNPSASEAQTGSLGLARQPS